MYNFFKDFIYLFLERGEGREEERERNINVGEKHGSDASRLLERTQPHNLGMCPDEELNWWPFSL